MNSNDSPFGDDSLTNNKLGLGEPASGKVHILPEEPQASESNLSLLQQIEKITEDPINALDLILAKELRNHVLGLISQLDPSGNIAFKQRVSNAVSRLKVTEL